MNNSLLIICNSSECIGRSGAKNDRAREAGSINQSLLTLGRVITALVDHHGHIPYRDSKLTRLLQESLGGKAKTCIIATLSPSQLAMEESLSTLDYAHRAKNIKNQPTVNQKMTKKVVLKEYCAEIEHLKMQLQLTREKNGVYVDPNEFYAMEARLASQESQLGECEAVLRGKAEEVKSLRAENQATAVELEGAKEQLEGVRADLEAITDKFTQTKSALETTEIELKATEAVVGEQTITEAELHEQGQYLTAEAESRRGDIGHLLSKVDRFVAIEQKRGTQTETMLALIGDTKSKMDAGIQQFLSSSDEKRTELESGLELLLARSRDTCMTLNGAIEVALGTLIGDATAAKTTMTESCDQLSVHLTSSNESVTATLKKAQTELSTWLSEACKAIVETKTFLKDQVAQVSTLYSISIIIYYSVCVIDQVESVKSTLVAYSDRFSQSTEQLRVQQSKLSDEARGVCESLRADVTEQTRSFQALQREQTQQSKRSMIDKANAIELVSIFYAST